MLTSASNTENIKLIDSWTAKPTYNSPTNKYNPSKTSESFVVESEAEITFKFTYNKISAISSSVPDNIHCVGLEAQLYRYNESSGTWENASETWRDYLYSTGEGWGVVHSYNLYITEPGAYKFMVKALCNNAKYRGSVKVEEVMLSKYTDRNSLTVAPESEKNKWIYELDKSNNKIILQSFIAYNDVDVIVYDKYLIDGVEYYAVIPDCKINSNGGASVTLTDLTSGGDVNFYVDQFTYLFNAGCTNNAPKYCFKIETITFQDNVDLSAVKNGYYMFAQCKSLLSVEMLSDYYHALPNYCVGMFYGCTNLTDINITLMFGNVLPDRLFYKCESLNRFHMSHNVTSMGKYVFYGCKSLKSVGPCGSNASVLLPSTLSKIGDYAFSNCTGITSVEIPIFIKELGDYAFNGITGITSINVPDQVTIIGAGAFASCINLADVTLGEQLTTLGSSAFANCKALKTFYIPSSVISIPAVGGSRSGILYNCSPTLKLYIGASRPHSDWKTFWCYYDERKVYSYKPNVTKETYELEYKNK